MELEHLDDNIIFLNQSFYDRDEMFQFVSNELLKNGYVTGQYLEKVIYRENNHPTGFKLKTINVAMPHVDSEFVKKNGMFLITSKKGILFKNAENDENVLVQIVFGLLLKQSDTHLNFLMKLASSFGNDQILQKIVESNSKVEIKNILKDILK
ncbi:PTS sugar transporter subunit IIA [Gilliamella sp. wkB112]|uniref:PTS sugar transporter subunit IIA n=1 Tax=Gilliamella sp. wkB112 TaxID=3120257 RepID=UPI00080E48C1|nr:PTS sugar transporter subunit IIA [Gilliamella apicola]OCG02163.1 hypothetical protein A9G12_10605 [Gilliamella apicola]